MSGFNIENSSFPVAGDLSSDISTIEAGLKIANAIQYEWYARDGSSCRFFNNWITFMERRLYASARQTTTRYKNAIAVNGDMSYLNLDFTPLAIGPKFLNIIVNGMVDRGFKVRAVSQDPLASEMRKKFYDEVEADMNAKDFLLQTQQQFGIDAFNVDPSELPETAEDFEIYKQLNDKLSIEMANEIAIDTIFRDNWYKEIERRTIIDIVTTGLGVVKHEFKPFNGISVNYVDSANFIYSYTEDPYLRDTYYHGEMKIVHKSELYKINPDLRKEEVDELAKNSSQINSYYPAIRRYNLFQQDSVCLLYFDYKTTEQEVFKVKTLPNGGKRVIKKDLNFNPEPNDNFEKKVIEREVWYEGVLVLGQNKLVKWEKCKNMVKSDATRQGVVSNYVACAPEMTLGVINSTINKMIPFIDQMQITSLKLQQLTSRMIPDGVFVDVDGINEVDLGNGASQTAIEALNMYYQTGSVIGRNKTQDGEFNNGKIPIQELNTSASQSKISTLINVFVNNMNMIRDLIGINEARDGTSPDPRALVGVQKMAALNSNTATRHILDAWVSITERIANCVSIRISDVLKWSDTKDELIRQIGRANVMVTEEASKLYLHSFGIYIDLEPDQEERNIFEQYIQTALNNQEIRLEDIPELRGVNNIKLGYAMLKYKQKQRQKEKEQREDMQSQMQQAMNLESMQAGVQATQAKAQAEAQAKIAIKNAETQGQIAVLQEEVKAKEYLMSVEFNYNMQLKGIEADIVSNKLKYLEDRKDDRTKLQATQQSSILEQRKKNLAAKDFESTNDHLGEFDLESFDPH